MDTIHREYVGLSSWAAEQHEREQIATILNTVRLSDAQLPDESPASIDDLLTFPSKIDDLSLDGRAADLAPRERG
jgi:hypothetical protein